MNSKSSQAARAFTIIELLVAVTIMMVIVFVLYGVFNQVQKALRSNITQVDVLESGRAAMELMARELEGMNHSGLSGGANFYTALARFRQNGAQATPLVQRIDSQTTRTNILQEFFFLDFKTNTWNGIGYVLEGGPGLGTLYRFSMRTNMRGLTSNNLSTAFFTRGLTNAATGERSTNFARVAEGIIHLRLVPYDPQGHRLGYDTTNSYPTYHILRRNSSGGTISDDSGMHDPNVILQQQQAEQTQAIFLSNAVPAFVDLELAILEPTALREYKALQEGSAAIATDFLKNQATKVHLFRQRIPIRTAPQ